MSVDNYIKAIKKIFPLALLGKSDDEIAWEAEIKNNVQLRIEDLLKEIHPDSCEENIADWERNHGIEPVAGAPIQARRDAVVAKIRERGSLRPQYYIDLATTLGDTITIEELQPPKAGIAKAGVAKVWPDEIVYVWEVTITSQALFYAKAGIAKAGDKILWKKTDNYLENLFLKLKPAFTQISFFYS